MSGPNYISKLQSGRLDLPKGADDKFRQFNQLHKVTSEPLVAEWMDDLVTRKGGEPLKSWKDRILCLESVCNTCKIPPSDLLVSNRNTEKILRSYAQLYREGKSVQDHRGKKAQNIRMIMYRKVQGIRDFCGYYGIIWRRGVGGIMSQKVIDHGKYADIRLTKEELQKADEFIKTKWGLDSDIYRWFWVGIESCARSSALCDMELDYTKSKTDSEKITFVMIAFEIKTKDIRGGKWYKYITRSDTQQSLELLKSRGGTRIYESKLSQHRFKKLIYKQLNQVYKHLGKTGSYFERHPTHVLRHIGAHYWLAKTDYNYGLIAEIGGWNTIDELKKSYGQIPPEKILEIIEEKTD